MSAGTNEVLVAVEFGQVPVKSWFKARPDGVWHWKSDERTGVYQSWGTRYEPNFSTTVEVFVEDARIQGMTRAYKVTYGPSYVTPGERVVDIEFFFNNGYTNAQIQQINGLQVGGTFELTAGEHAVERVK